MSKQKQLRDGYHKDFSALGRERRERRAARAVAASAVGLHFGAVECGPGVPPDEHIAIVKVDGHNVQTECVMPVQWLITRNKSALAKVI